MARVTFTPLVAALSGSMSDATFATWKGQPYVRTRVVPANPETVDRRAQKDRMKHAVSMYQSASSIVNDISENSTGAWWNDAASGLGISGYNLYVRQCVAALKTAVAGLLTPSNAAYVVIADVVIAEGSSAGEIDVTWDKGSGDDDVDEVLVATRCTEPDHETYAWVFETPIPVETETATISGLTANYEYEVAVFCRKKDKSTAQVSTNDLVSAHE